MKTLLFALLFFVGTAQAALIKNLGTDAYPTTGDQPVSCNLYLGGVLVVNSPVSITGGAASCKFVGITLQPNQVYTATAVDATGFESAQSLPLTLPAGPAIPANLRVVP